MLAGLEEAVAHHACMVGHVPTLDCPRERVGLRGGHVVGVVVLDAEDPGGEALDEEDPGGEDPDGEDPGGEAQEEDRAVYPEGDCRKRLT